MVFRFHGNGVWIPAGVYPILRYGAGMTVKSIFVIKNLSNMLKELSL